MSDTDRVSLPTIRTHELKTVRPYFGAVWGGEKTAELRKNDRGFQVGDLMLLREYLPDEFHYTGYAIRAEITDIVTDAEGEWLAEGHVMLSFKILDLIMSYKEPANVTGA